MKHVYTKAGNLKIELIDIPSGFKLEGIETSEIDKGNGNIQYKTTATLPYFQNANLKGAKWKITAGGRLGSPWTVDIEPRQVIYTVRNGLLNKARTYMERIETYFIAQLCDDAKNAQSDNPQSLKELKKQITAHQTSFSLNSKYKEASDLPDGIYESFARAVLDTLTNSNIDKFEVDINKPAKLPEQIYDQIAKGIDSDNFSVNLNGKTYSVRYSITALSFMKWGGGYAEATVSWKESYGTETWQLIWASSYKAGINALSHYCAVLAQLEIDVWKDFLATFVTDMFGIGKDKVRSALDKAEIVIRAMCGDENAARSLIEDIKDKGNEKLKDWIEKGFKKLVLKFFPNGQKFLDDAKKINDVRKKREEELSKAIAAYNSAKSAMDAQKADEKITYVWGQFKTAYNKLKEIHIYEGSNSIKFPNLND